MLPQSSKEKHDEDEDDTPSTSFVLTESNFTTPQHQKNNFNTPQHSFNTPQHIYNTPQQVYNTPQLNEQQTTETQPFLTQPFLKQQFQQQYQTFHHPIPPLNIDQNDYCTVISDEINKRQHTLEEVFFKQQKARQSNTTPSFQQQQQQQNPMQYLSSPDVTSQDEGSSKHRIVVPIAMLDEFSSGGGGLSVEDLDVDDDVFTRKDDEEKEEEEGKKGEGNDEKGEENRMFQNEGIDKKKDNKVLFESSKEAGTSKTSNRRRSTQRKKVTPSKSNSLFKLAERNQMRRHHSQPLQQASLTYEQLELSFISQSDAEMSHPLKLFAEKYFNVHYTKAHHNNPISKTISLVTRRPLVVCFTVSSSICSVSLFEFQILDCCFSWYKVIH